RAGSFIPWSRSASSACGIARCPLNPSTCARRCRAAKADMTNDSQSGDRPADINRRGFLTRVAGTALVVGAASPTLDLLAAFPEPAATPGSVFRPGFAETDAALFAEARKHF